MARRRTLLALLTALALAACTAGEGSPTVAGAAVTSTSTSTTLATTTTSTSTTTTLPPTTTTAAPVRTVIEQDWAPFATVGGVTLVHPSRRVERIGFHQSNNDGAQAMTALTTTANPVVLEDRERDTVPAGAADVVVDPDLELRAPVTGTVIRGGGYTLYCDHSDEFLVFEPDEHPGWEVKMLHIHGLHVSRGDHVVAGETVIADGARILPFESQVDELRTVDPAWPHTHIEVVDPTIPERPTPGGCG